VVSYRRLVVDPRRFLIALPILALLAFPAFASAKTQVSVVAVPGVGNVLVVIRLRREDACDASAHGREDSRRGADSGADRECERLRDNRSDLGSDDQGGGRRTQAAREAEDQVLQGRRELPKTVKLKLPATLKRTLKRTGKLSMQLTARVKDPAGNTRTVKKKITPRLKR
jgi:hypothetical protein